MFEWWNKYGLEILVVVSLVFFFIYWFFFRRDKKGTYSRTYHYTGKPRRRLPQESKSEKLCKNLMEEFFQKPFQKVRPNWLKNDITKRNLELDVYNQELMLAVEVQGQGHYHYNKAFHKNYQDFLTQQYRDDIKRKKCKENGVILLEVPYTVKPEHMKEFLRKELKNVGFQV